MNFPISCMECFRENGMSSFNFKNFDITDDGIYELECEKGHNTVTILQNEKFEVLFDMGVNAFLEGYKQEAIVCMASSLERFYEWCISILLLKNNIDADEFKKTWKLVSKQSERQIGAFYFLYLQEFKKAPEVFNSAMKTFNNKDVVSFRNNVIHNGYIPKYNQVMEYADILFSYMFNILKLFKTNYEDFISENTRKRLFELHKKFKFDLTSGMHISTSLGLFYSGIDYESRTFKTILDGKK